MKLSGTCDPWGVLKVCNSGVTSLHYHLGDFSPNCLGLSHICYDLVTVGQLFRTKCSGVLSGPTTANRDTEKWRRVYGRHRRPCTLGNLCRQGVRFPSNAGMEVAVNPRG